MTRPMLLLLLVGCATPGTPLHLADARAPLEAPSGFVHRDGRRLLDGQGQPIRLRGPALGGWLTWESWMWGGSWHSETQMMSAFTKLVGARDAERFRDEVQSSMVTRADFAQMRAFGFNNVKLPVNHRVLEDDAKPFVYKPEGWARLDGILDAAEHEGVYVAIDLHAAPCGQMRAFVVDPGTDTNPDEILWDSAQCQERTVRWWQAVAERYRDRSIVSAYVLMGEPWPNRCVDGPKPGAYCGPIDSCGFGGRCEVQGGELVSLYTRIVAAIRAVDPNHLIVLEGAHFSQDFSMFSGRLDENSAYGPHDYYWDGGNPRSLLAGWKRIAARDELPLWVGEMGLNVDHRATADQVQLYNADPEVSGWAYWSWKMTPSHTWSWLTGSNKYLLGIQTTPKWDRLMVWLNNPALHSTPTPIEARAGMAEFVRSVRVENNLFDAATLSALACYEPATSTP